MRYSRDLRGYGETTPDPKWPGGARIAVQIVLNYEEGGENSIEHGDAASEAFLSEIIGAQPWPGKRHWNMESIYDYGARSGFWRRGWLPIPAACSRHAPNWSWSCAVRTRPASASWSLAEQAACSAGAP